MKRWLWLVPLVGIFVVGLYQAWRPLPTGLAYEGMAYQVRESDITFFSDRTYSTGESVAYEQEIFDEVLRMINAAPSYMLIDFFFYSDFLGTETESHRALSRELTDALLAKKQQNPNVTIQVITDPINTMYGGYASPLFAELTAAGIPVLVTDVRALKDSNPLYSSVWRTFLQWFGVGEGGWLPNLLDSRKPNVSLRAYLASFNFKANHRKVVLVDRNVGGGTAYSTLITSANPHDGSSANSNIAIRIDSGITEDVLASEEAVAALAGAKLIMPAGELPVSETKSSLSVTLLTEGAIEARALTLIDGATASDHIDIAMFYLSDRDIVDALTRADARGVTLRMLLDPNKDAFGREKNGIPNRQVAHELMTNTKGNTTVRWCDTHGEQCHAKLLMVTKGTEAGLLQGSANFTRRNLDNLNLETDVYIEGVKTSKVFTDAQGFFEDAWTNEGGKGYSVAYETYADTSWFKTLRYRVMEFTGMSRF